MRLWLALVALFLVGCTGQPPVPPPSEAHRIVSLVPSLTEVLFSLGAGSRVAGVTVNDTFPPEVALLPRVGSQVPDYERLVSLKPDLVVTDPGLQPREIERLRQLGLPVLELEAQSLEGLQKALLELGARTGSLARAEELRSAIKRRLHGFERRTGPRTRVFLEIWNRPLMTCGAGTYPDELVRLAGGENTFADLRDYPQISVEELLLRQPEVIILTVGDVDEARQRPGWSRLEAVRQGRVYKLDPDLLVRPTLRFPQAVEQLAERLHP